VGVGLLLVYVFLFAQMTRSGIYYHTLAWAPVALAALYALAWTQRAPSPQPDAGIQVATMD
jgi:hypothetical protein